MFLLNFFDPCKSVLSVLSVVRFAFLCKAKPFIRVDSRPTSDLHHPCKSVGKSVLLWLIANGQWLMAELLIAALLLPQRNHRVHAHGSASRDKCSQQRNSDQRGSHHK